MFNQLQLCFHLVHAIEVDFCVTTANCLCPESGLQLGIVKSPEQHLHLITTGYH